MQNIPKNLRPQDKLLIMMSGILSGAITLLFLRILPIEQSIIISAIMLASLIVLSAYLSNSLLWWMAVAAIAGMVIDIGGILGEDLAESKTPLEFEHRLTFVVFQSIAGFISGIIWGRQVHQAHIPTLKEFLSSLSGLTVGIFAVLVTIRFIMDGLEPARSLSSRLSTTTTILITLLAIPGSIGYLLAEKWKKAGKDNKSDHIG